MNDDTDACVSAPPVDIPAEPGEATVLLAQLAKALGHPTRVEIIRILTARDSCMCGEIVDLLPSAQSTVSQHLKVLRDAGLIRGDISGPRVCYCVNTGMLVAARDLLDGLLPAAVPA